MELRGVKGVGVGGGGGGCNYLLYLYHMGYVYHNISCLTAEIWISANRDVTLFAACV